MKKITNLELIDFAKSKLGVPYVYGCKGEKLTIEKYNALKQRYGSNCVWDSDVNKVGKVCCDCSGLIQWATGVALGSYQLYERAYKRELISTINRAPLGALVWQRGHVGIYIGNGEYIAEDGSAYGCRINKLSKAKFTHWLLMDYIDYSSKDKKDNKEGEEVVEKSKIIVDDKEINVERILKDGSNFIKIRDIAESLGYEIENKGNIAVLKKR